MKEHDPKNLREPVDLGDHYLVTHQGEKDKKKFDIASNGKPKKDQIGEASDSGQKGRRSVKCFRCGKWGHLTFECTAGEQTIKTGKATEKSTRGTEIKENGQRC